MAPGGDWLARKILGSAIVDEMDRRNGAAEQAFQSAGKKARDIQFALSSSHYSESPRESKERGGSHASKAVSQHAAAAAAAQPSRRQSNHHSGVGMRGGDAPFGSKYSGDSPSSYRRSERKLSQRHSSRHPSQASQAADGEDLLVNPYGVANAAADSNHSINYAVHESSRAAAGSHRQASGQKSQNIEVKDFASRPSNHRSVLSALDRHTEDVYPRPSRHNAAPSIRH
ncbi:MAG: hypothetical protein L6R41_005437 [Letrouitia leprolyta]|nr:MAG: hypothetical protein L6R41_005437 [Letrouitia leprolyta]